MRWYTDWFVGLLIVSGFCLICKGGWLATVALWILYLSKGWKDIHQYPSQENYDKFKKHFNIGIVVVFATIIFQISAS